MAAENDPDRPTGHQVLEPTAVFRPVNQSSRTSDPETEEWMERLGLFRQPGGAAPGGARLGADENNTQKIDPARAVSGTAAVRRNQ